MALATTLLPLPTQPPPIYLGQFYSPYLIAFLGALGAACSHFCEYHVIRFFLEKGKLKWLNENPKLEKIKAKVKDHLFWGLLISAATGIVPSDLVRLFSTLTKFNPFLASLAIFIGRFPRYFMWAYLGQQFKISFQTLALLFVILLLLALFHMVRRRRLLPV